MSEKCAAEENPEAAKKAKADVEKVKRVRKVRRKRRSMKGKKRVRQVKRTMMENVKVTRTRVRRKAEEMMMQNIDMVDLQYSNDILSWI